MKESCVLSPFPVKLAPVLSPMCPLFPRVAIQDFLPLLGLLWRHRQKYQKPIIQKLNTEINRILNMPEIKNRLQTSLGTEPLIMSPEQLTEFTKTETAKWATAVKVSGAKVD
jgi:hypothetical protein